ncbi:MAG: chromosome partitioning protein ParA [Alistipes sp.]|nr:chromosome partitioning protein ParA [Alistipes sp.]
MTESTNIAQPVPSSDENQDAGGITLHDILRMVIANWYWFALSMIVCLGLGYFYLASTPRIYSRTATILVKDSRKGGDMEVAAFNDLAGFQSRRNVDNEVFILQSRRLMSEVVGRLNLTTGYIIRGTLRDRDLYGQSPVEVRFIDDNENQRLAMQLTPRGEERFELTAFNDGFTSPEEAKRVLPGSYGDTITTPFGQVVVNKTYYMSAAYDGKPIQIVKSTLAATTSLYRAQVRCEVANKLSSIVRISMDNTVPKRAEDVINTLITVYNDDAINDKRQISVSTSKFIKDRLELISRELGDVDRDVEQLKRDNKMVDISSEAGRNMAESSHYKTESLSLDNQIQVSEFIRSYLNDPANAKELIPMMASVTNAAISSQIDEYNEAVLHRAKLIENSSEHSPVIQEMDNRLAAVRRSIISSLSSHISTLELQRNALQQQEVRATHRISALPSQEKALLSITRQQKIKEELFLYLLNKQEETQLNYAIAESNSRIIDRAYGSNAPVSPKPLMILGAALLCGFAIPFGLLFLIGMLDTSIRGRRDVEEHLSIPFLGDIPYSDGTETVREAGRDPLSEAFRILRSNISFMNVSAGKNIRTILITSSDPHAGKTFVCKNLAITLASAGKRVLILDLDLRRHAFSSSMGQSKCQTGITAYLTGQTTDLDKLIKPTGLHKNLDAIYSL